MDVVPGERGPHIVDEPAVDTNLLNSCQSAILKQCESYFQVKQVLINMYNK
jgi:hypothetical protein